MRVINANEVVKAILTERDKIPYELVSEKPFKHGNSMRGGIRKALRCIEQAPTIDAVPVVRCRECKHHHDCDTHFCDALGMDCPDDSEFFCSYGERKEGAT